MPPVPVHIDDPITPSKTCDGASTTNTATTATDQQNQPYPAAQPGAAAVPAPTPHVPNHHPQPTPTRTTPMSDYSPPAPQPGAVPVPFGQQALTTSPLPPPPKPGEAAAQKQAQVTQPPSQMMIPPPQSNYAPVHGSSPTSAHSQARGGPTTLNFGAAPAPQKIGAGSHPPGYHQNANAQEMSSAARASLEQAERRESSFAGLGGGGGLGVGENDTATNVWNTVKGWANTAGTNLAAAEKQVWQRINKST